MSSDFLQDGLWRTITKLAKRAKRKHIAVGYLGTGASGILPLRRGDSIVVDMSLAAVKSGQTNPFEIAKYMKNGAGAFTCENLHAKVYVFDNAAVVCSGNLSFHSQNALVEAGVLTREPSVVKMARGFIKSIQVEPITPEYLKICKKAYKPPRFSAKGKAKPRKNEAGPRFSRLWVSGIDDVEFSDAEEKISQRESKRAMKEVTNKKKYEVNSIRWVDGSHFIRSVKKGDLVLQIYHHKAYPPARVVRVSKYKLPGKKLDRFLVHLEDEKKPKLFAWKDFKKFARQAGLPNLGENSMREVRSVSASHKLLGLWH